MDKKNNEFDKQMEPFNAKMKIFENKWMLMKTNGRVPS
jgi:hypothetical protein